MTATIATRCPGPVRRDDAGRDRLAGEGSGHLAAGQLGRVLGHRRAGRSRVACPRHRAGRPGRDPLGEPARVALHRRRHGRRPRRHRRSLPDQPGRRGRLPAPPLGCEGADRRGPGAGRQGAGDRRPARSQAHRVRRAARHPVPVRRPAADRLARFPCARQRAPRGESARGEPSGWTTRDRTTWSR